MSVPSPQFLLFAAAAALLFNVPAGERWRAGVMLAANLLFLMSFVAAPRTLLPFAGFIAFGFLAQRLSAAVRASRLFVGLLVTAIALFVWLKRYTFVPGALFLPFPYLLVGLSYVFFRVLHLIIETHQRGIEERIGLVSYLNYTLNFTSLVSGPIQQYPDFRRMEVEPRPLDLVIAGRAVERIIWGYFKVAVVASLLIARQHRALDALPDVHDLADRVAAAMCIPTLYLLYLYFNFSGYMDVVIGVARFFRLDLPENFDRPFAAENAIIFWGRWHMTLSNWLKTYVYNPFMVAAMTRFTAPQVAPYLSVAAFFVTFFLVGLWHGQTSEFLFYGLLLGGGVAVNKLYQLELQRRLDRKRYRALAAQPLYRAVCRGLTFTCFAFSLLWFWSSWGQLADAYHRLGLAACALGALSLWSLASVVLAGLEALRAAVLRVTWHEAPLVHSRYVRTALMTALSVITVTLIVLLDTPAPDIVYKSF